MSCHKTDSIKIWLTDFWPFCISWQLQACDLPKYLFWRIYETNFFHDETHNSNSPSKYKYQVVPSSCTGSYKLHINISLKMLPKAFYLFSLLPSLYLYFFQLSVSLISVYARPREFYGLLLYLLMQQIYQNIQLQSSTSWMYFHDMHLLTFWKPKPA